MLSLFCVLLFGVHGYVSTSPDHLGNSDRYKVTRQGSEPVSIPLYWAEEPEGPTHVLRGSRARGSRARNSRIKVGSRSRGLLSTLLKSRTLLFGDVVWWSDVREACSTVPSTDATATVSTFVTVKQPGAYDFVFGSDGDYKLCVDREDFDFVLEIEVMSASIRQSTEVQISVSDAPPQTEGGTFTFQLSLNAALSLDLTVTFSVAYNQSDIPSSVGTVSIAAGETSKAFEVSAPVLDIVIQDSSVTLSMTQPNAIQYAGQETVSLADGIGESTLKAAAPTFSCNPASAEEGEEQAVVTCGPNKKSNVDMVVSYSTVLNGACTVDANDGTVSFDVAEESGTLTWPFLSNPATTIDGKTIIVSLKNDDIQEPEKTCKIDLQITSTDSTNYMVENAFFTLRDEEHPSVSVSNNTVDEGAGSIEFAVTVSHPYENDVTVTLVRSDTQENIDIEITGSRLLAPQTFGSGCSYGQECTYSFPVEDNDVVQPNIPFSVSLSITGDTTTALSPGAGLILDNEDATLEVLDARAVEADSPLMVFRVAISHEIAAGQSAILTAQTRDGSATSVFDSFSLSNVDYESMIQNITIDKESKEAGLEIEVQILNDNLQEYNESFYVDLTLDGGLPLTLVKNFATGSIIDDRECPTFVVDDGENFEYDSMEFLVHLSHSFQRLLVFRETLRSAEITATTLNEGSAVMNQDFANKSSILRYPFSNIEGSKEQRFLVPLNNDAEAEDDETFAVEISSAVPRHLYCNQPISRAKATGVIKNNEGVSITLSGGRAVEGQDAFIVFTLTLSTAAPLDMIFFPTVESCQSIYDCDGEATGRLNTRRDVEDDEASKDFAEAILDLGSPPMYVTIPALETVAYISIPLHDDDVVEPFLETFFLNVRPAPENVLSVRPTKHQGSIQDNDYALLLIRDGVAMEDDNFLAFDFSLDALVEGDVAVQTSTYGGTAVMGYDFAPDEYGEISTTIQPYTCNDKSPVNATCKLEVRLLGNDVVDPGPAKTILQKVDRISVDSKFKNPVWQNTGPDPRGSTPAAVTPIPVNFTGFIERSGEDATISINTITVTENAGVIQFPVYLSHPSTVDIEVAYTMIGLWKCLPGQDYNLPQDNNCIENSCRFTIPQSCQNGNVHNCQSAPIVTYLDIEIIDDTVTENFLEYIEINLLEVLTYPDSFQLIDPTTAYVIIEDDDVAIVSLGDAELVEESSSNITTSVSYIQFPVILSHKVDVPLSFTYNDNATKYGKPTQPGTAASVLRGPGGDPSSWEVDGIDYYADLGTSYKVDVPSFTQEWNYVLYYIYSSPIINCDDYFNVFIDGYAVAVVSGGGPPTFKKKDEYPLDYRVILSNETSSTYVPSKFSYPPFYKGKDQNNYQISPAVGQTLAEDNSNSPTYNFSVTRSRPTEFNVSLNFAFTDTSPYSDSRIVLLSPAVFESHKTVASVSVAKAVNDFKVQPLEVKDVINITLQADGSCPFLDYSVEPSTLQLGIEDNEDATISIYPGATVKEGEEASFPVIFSHDISTDVSFDQTVDFSFSRYSSPFGGSDVVYFVGDQGINQTHDAKFTVTKDNCIMPNITLTARLGKVLANPDEEYDVSNASSPLNMATLTVINVDTASFSLTSAAVQSQNDFKYTVAYSYSGCLDDDVSGYEFEIRIENAENIPLEFFNYYPTKVTFSNRQKYSDFSGNFSLLTMKQYPFGTATDYNFNITINLLQVAPDLEQYFTFPELTPATFTTPDDYGEISVDAPNEVFAGDTVQISVKLSSDEHPEEISYEYAAIAGVDASDFFSPLSGSASWASKTNQTHTYSVTTLTQGFVWERPRTFNFSVFNFNPAYSRAASSCLNGPTLYPQATQCEQRISIKSPDKVVITVDASDSFLEKDEGQDITFAISFSLPADFTFTYDFNCEDGTAIANVNYVPPTNPRTVAPSQTNNQYIKVETIFDSHIHNPLTFTGKVAKSAGSSDWSDYVEVGTPSSAVATIRNAEKATITISNATASSPYSTPLKFTVHYDGSVPVGDLTVTVTMVDGTAEYPFDFITQTKNITIPGESTGKIVNQSYSVEVTLPQSANYPGPPWTYIQPELYFNAALSLSANPLDEFIAIGDPGTGTLEKFGSPSFSIESVVDPTNDRMIVDASPIGRPDVLEGMYANVQVRNPRKQVIRKALPSFHLKPKSAFSYLTTSEFFDRAIAGVDYEAKEGEVIFSALDPFSGVIEGDSLTSSLKVQTFMSQAFTERALFFEYVPKSMNIDYVADLIQDPLFHINEVTGWDNQIAVGIVNFATPPFPTSYNCPKPLRYYGSASEAGLVLDVNGPGIDIPTFPLFLGVTINVGPCFNSNAGFFVKDDFDYTMTFNNKSFHSATGLYNITNSLLNLTGAPNERRVLAITACTVEVQGLLPACSTLEVIVTGNTNVNIDLSTLRESGIYVNLNDYWSATIMNVPDRYMRGPPGLYCFSFYDGQTEFSGNVPCCSIISAEYFDFEWGLTNGIKEP